MFTHLQDVLEDVLLHVSVVHTHRASADLGAVQHEVIVLSSDLFAHKQASITSQSVSQLSSRERYTNKHAAL